MSAAQSCIAFELDDDEEEEEEEEAREEADEAAGAMATAPPIRSRTRTGRRTALVKPSWWVAVAGGDGFIMRERECARECECQRGW